MCLFTSTGITAIGGIAVRPNPQAVAQSDTYSLCQPALSYTYYPLGSSSLYHWSSTSKLSLKMRT